MKRTLFTNAPTVIRLPGGKPAYSGSVLRAEAFESRARGLKECVLNVVFSQKETADIDDLMWRLEMADSPADIEIRGEDGSGCYGKFFLGDNSSVHLFVFRSTGPVTFKQPGAAPR